MKNETFMSLLKDTINKLENGTILNHGRKLSYSTIKSYKGVYNTMKSYKFNFDLEVLDLNNVTNRKDRIKVKRKLQQNVNKYLNMLLEDCKHPNTRKSHLKTIRTTLKKAEEEYGYWFPKLQSIRELQTEVIAMSPEQVEFLHTNKPNQSGLLESWYYTRLMLYSCMRVSDLVKFDCTVEGDAVTIITKKGLGSISTFYLPLDVKEYVAEKKEFGYTTKNFREKLKTLLKSYTEFQKKKVVYAYDHEGHPKSEEHFLYDLFTPHKLRSSGITYHLSRGLSELNVRHISGHAQGSTAFYRYVSYSDKESINQQKENVNMLINK
tara:strand:- start:921 stop:1886 length:966 start_codon:yes stop_codon:yes gene_type:complete